MSFSTVAGSLSAADKPNAHRSGITACEIFMPRLYTLPEPTQEHEEIVTTQPRPIKQ